LAWLPKPVKTPYEVEKETGKEIIRVELIHKAHHWLILHGRYICVARNPKCEECGLREVCHYFKTGNKYREAGVGQIKEKLIFKYYPSSKKPNCKNFCYALQLVFSLLP
jgi:adenine-specific DNA glycosylase